MDKEQLLAMFPFEKMEINLQVTKGDNGLEISGTVTTQVSDEDKTENPEAEAPEACEQNQPPAPEKLNFDYEVLSVRPSGKSSQLLELADKNGKITAAYIKVGTKPITIGSCLTEVDIQQKTGAYGDYKLINDCRVAA